MNPNLEQNILLSAHTTLHVGGVADYFVEVQSQDELTSVLANLPDCQEKPLIIGGGSNLLIADGGYRGLVIKVGIKGMSKFDDSLTALVEAGAGENFDDFVAWTTEQGLWGLENLSHIPGSVGATPVQNVGAYGVDISDLVDKVETVNLKTQELKVFSKEECEFAYRESFFKTEPGRDWVITKVTFRLTAEHSPRLTYGSLSSAFESEPQSPEEVRKEVISIRSGKFPDWRTVGTAGSFFKNPVINKAHFERLQSQYQGIVGYELGDNLVKVSLGWVLDHVCELRGHCKGKVCLYENQALVLVNNGTESAAEIDEFASWVAEEVKNKTEIQIEREVRTIL